MTKSTSADNPLGILAIDHLEFTCDSLNTATKDLFTTFGFTKTFVHEAAKQELFAQGQVRFLLSANEHPDNLARQYFQRHGEGVSALSFLVENAEVALARALERGAELVSPLCTQESEHGVYRHASIKGFGDVRNEFIERPMAQFRPEFSAVEGDPKARPLRSRCARIDHLTNNVPHGEMQKWVDFYQRVYGFKVTRYFDIKGSKTGLLSQVVQLPGGAVIIPINEPAVSAGKSQIQEFLDRHRGAGVQHIALTCSDIISTVGELRERGIKFLAVPATYYEDLPHRDFQVTEDLAVLERLNLLVDGDREGHLLQIFTDTYVGPLFFEFIQRKNHDGFGEGNFQALFDAIERDQIKRGYLKE